MKRTLEDRVALMEEFFDDLLKGIMTLLRGQRASDAAAAATHNLQDFEMRMLLLAALKHHPLKNLVNLTTQELLPMLKKDLEEDVSPRDQGEHISLDALLEAAVLCSSGGLKKRFVRRGNQTPSEFLFADWKAGIRELDPDLNPESPEFRTALTLMAAAYYVGPQVDRLVEFTGYTTTFVADIAQRMRAYGLWSDERVSTDHWWDGDRITGTFWLDCLVADGLVYVERTEDGEELYSPFNPESKNPN